MVTYQRLLFSERPLCVCICGVCTAGEPQIPGVKNMHSRNNHMGQQLRCVCMRAHGMLVLPRKKKGFKVELTEQEEKCLANRKWEMD